MGGHSGGGDTQLDNIVILIFLHAGSADRHADHHRIAGVEKLISKLSEITGEWKILGEDLGVSRSRIERIQLD